MPLQRAGLDIINVSLDTLRADRYEVVTRRRGWERIMAGIDLALQLEYTPVKVTNKHSPKTTVQLCRKISSKVNVFVFEANKILVEK